MSSNLYSFCGLGIYKWISRNFGQRVGNLNIHKVCLDLPSDSRLSLNPASFIISIQERQVYLWKMTCDPLAALLRTYDEGFLGELDLFIRKFFWSTEGLHSKASRLDNPTLGPFFHLNSFFLGLSLPLPLQDQGALDPLQLHLGLCKHLFKASNFFFNDLCYLCLHLSLCFCRLFSHFGSLSQMRQLWSKPPQCLSMPT